MKPIWLVIGIIAIVLGLAGAFAIGAFAFTQRPAGPVVSAVGPGAVGRGWGMLGPGGMTLAPHSSAGVGGRGGLMMGPGFVTGGGFAGGLGGQQNSLIDIAAKDLNLTVNDLFTELQKGKSIADVAKDKSVSTDKIVDDYVAARTQALKSAVEAKQLTQAQADAMLALTKANAAQALTRTPTTGGFGFGMTLAPHASAGVGQSWNGTGPVGPNYPMMGGGMMGGRGWR